MSAAVNLALTAAVLSGTSKGPVEISACTLLAALFIWWVIFLIVFAVEALAPYSRWDKNRWTPFIACALIGVAAAFILRFIFK